MKKLELSNFGVQEMDAREMNDIDGGGFPWLAAARAFYYLATYGGRSSEIHGNELRDNTMVVH